MSSTADDTLFQRWMREHDAHAFAEIVSRHSGMVYGVCRRILKNEADAEDVAQDCFIELAQTRRTVKRSLAGWLHALAASRSLDRIRADKRRLKREAHFAAEATPASKADWRELWAEVDEAIAALPEHLREPIVCRFLENAPQEEIARRLGSSRSTIQRRLDEGIQQIRVFLQQRGFVVPLAGIVAAFTAHTAEAAPAVLLANLGKLALSGGAMSGAGGMAAAGGAGVKAALTGGGSLAMVTKLAIGVGVLAIAMGAVWAGSALTKEKNDAGVASVSEQPAPEAKEPMQKTVPSTNEESAPVVADAGMNSENVDLQPAANDNKTPADPNAMATLQGRLVDSRGFPVGKAHLIGNRMDGQRFRSSETDESGAFKSRHIPPGEYSFTGATYRADDTSGLMISGLRIEPAQVIALAPDETKRDVLIKLADPVGQATLKIRVVNEQGEPVPRAQLMITLGEFGVAGPSTDEEGRYWRYHAPDWESEARVEVHHRDCEMKEFVVPISDEESELVVAARTTRAFAVKVVDGRTGRGITGAEVSEVGVEVGEDVVWQSTQDGVIAFTELSASIHRFEARAPGYQSVLAKFSLESEDVQEGTIAMFPPATVRLEFDVEDSMKGIVRRLDENSVHLSVTAANTKDIYILGEAQWQSDYAVTHPIGAGQPSDVMFTLKARPRPEDWPHSDITIMVSGLVVAEEQEAKLQCAVGRGTCVLRIPQIEGVSPAMILTREGDGLGVRVENATYQGISERRVVYLNPSGNMCVAGELYPGTYKLNYRLADNPDAGEQQQLITFTKEDEEIVLDWGE